MTATLIDDLQARGLIAQTTNIDVLKDHLAQARTIYCGFDPTAGSLHIGHLVPLIMLRRFQNAGHYPLALIGGATGMIGDPSFKDTERSLNAVEQVNSWVDTLSEQIRALLNTGTDKQPTIVSNAQWMQSINIIDFLRDTGKHFSVNAMMNRDSVRQRLQRPEQGLSFTEFSYTLLQSYDFAHLNQAQQCTVQIGGNDQWGNIVSGIDLTRRMHGEQVFGITLPLITKADGTKFGKTEGGAIWLDPALTSPYRFYQFWLNTSDNDVYNLLRYYTFLPVSQIDDIEIQDRHSDDKPAAQQILADEVTRFVHGQEGLDSAKRISRALFNGRYNALSQSELTQLAHDGLPHLCIDSSVLVEDALLATALAKSKRQAREFIQSGAVRINGEK